MPTMGALEGVRVVDFGQYLAGPLLALLLAEHGADVVHVDPPGGPMWPSDANAILQRSKRSLVLNLKDPDDLALAADLVAHADVAIEGFRPGVMTRLGLGPEQAMAGNPGLVWCSLPGFGRTDPRADLPGWEGLVSAAAGAYLPNPWDVSGEPRFSAVPVASTFAAAIAAHSVVAGLLTRRRTGCGDLIEVPLFDALFDAIGVYAEQPRSLEQLGIEGSQDEITNSAFTIETPYRCQDGRFLAHCGVPPRGLHRFWEAYLPVELKYRRDPAAVAQVHQTLTDLFASRPAHEWERLLQEKFGAAVATSQSSADWLQDDHALASRSVVPVADELLGATVQPGAVAMLSEHRCDVRHPRRPIGADTDELRDAARMRTGWFAAPRGSRAPISGAASPDLPLRGQRVLDFTNLLAGPIGARVLAEYGAEVVKVTATAVGLGSVNRETDDPKSMIGHRTTNAGKRSVFVDLKTADGREILDRLLASADVVHTNNPPAAAQRLGLDEQSVRAINPALIYSSTRLHASGGWRSGFLGHEDLAQHVTGMALRYGGGFPDGMHAILVNDHGTGHFAAFGVLLALYARGQEVGPDEVVRGETVETALSRTCTYMQVPFMVGHEKAVWDEPGGRDAWGWGALDRLYRTADGWLWLAAAPEQEAAVLGAIGIARDAVAATGDSAALTAAIAQRLADDGSHRWVEALRAVGVPAHVYRLIPEAMQSEDVRARGLSVTRDHPGIGTGVEVGVIDRFASRPRPVLAPAVVPGSDTVDLLRELGYDDAAVTELVQSRVVATDDAYSCPSS